MATLLHVFAHPQPEHSQTMRIADAFVESYRDAHPGDTIEVLDLYAVGVPHLSAAHMAAMLLHDEPDKMSPEAQEAWQEIIAKVTQFTSADKYLVTAPMWNFGVPSIMKAYIDHVMLAGYTFRFTGPGSYVGMMAGRPLVIISSHGGIYSQPPMSDYEMCVNYLRDVFGFLGFTIAAEITAEGLALVGQPQQDRILQPAIEKAREAAKTL